MLIPHRYCFIPANIFIFSSFKDSRVNNLEESHAYHALLLCVLEQRMFKFDTRWVLKENKGLKKRDTRVDRQAELQLNGASWANGGGSGGALWLEEVKSTPVVRLLKHQFSILHLLLPQHPVRKLELSNSKDKESLFKPFVCVTEGETAREARDYPPGYRRSTSSGVHFIKYEQSFLGAAYSCFLIQNPGLAISDLQIWQQKDFMSLPFFRLQDLTSQGPTTNANDFIAM